MRLSSLFTPGNQVNTENISIDAKTLEQNLKNGLEQIAGKVSGETVSGTVIDKTGLEVLLSIGKNQLLQARLEGNMQVDIGKQMTFAIKNTIGGKVMLSPLFTNMASDPNISKALKMAGIPENETSVNMVKTMMAEGMSIDQNSLHQMMRLVNQNPKAEMETIIQLTRLQIPVTEEMISQMEAYKGFEHQLTEGIMTLADALSETVKTLNGEGNFQGSISLCKEVFNILTEQEIKGVVGEGQIANEGQMQIDADGQMQTTADRQIVITSGRQGYADSNAASMGWSGNDTATPTEYLKEAGLTRLSDFFSENIIPEEESETGRLFESETFNKLIKQELKNQWMISPEDVSEENTVKNLYERLNNQLHRLSSVLEQTANQTPLAKVVNTLTGNIDFMNQLNQMFTYVQIPLKLQRQEANGELYVYTNRKNPAKEDGVVSALLHLDMEHLGSVDVHVSMKENKVATKFYLQDDSALDLIADNIEMLNSRLNKRGYEMNASFIQKEQNRPVIEEILEQDRNISVLSGYSFDARA